MSPNEWKGLFRDWGIALVITVVAIGIWQAMTPKPAGEGSAPPLTVPQVDGQPFALTDRRAKAYVVNFWATWCGPCRAEIPEFAAFARAHPEVEVYGVSVDDMGGPQLEAAAAGLGITYPVLHDKGRDAAHAWGVKTYPTTFVLSASHDIVAVRVGRIDRQILEKLVADAR